MVSKDLSDVNQSTSIFNQGGTFTTTTTQQEQNPPTMAQASTDGLSLVWKRLGQQNSPTRNCDIIMESWRTETTKQYWISGQTLQQQKNETLAKVLEFLTLLYESGGS